MGFSLAVGACSSSVITSSLLGGDEWGEFAGVRLHYKARSSSKEIRKN